MLLTAALLMTGCAKVDAPDDTSSQLINVDNSGLEYEEKTSSSSEPTESKPTGTIITRPAIKDPIVPQGIAEDINSIFDLPRAYNTTFKPNIDDGTEIILEVVPTASYPTSTLNGLDPNLSFEKMYEYWKGSNTPPIQISFDDTSYSEIANTFPVDYGLTCTGGAAEELVAVNRRSENTGIADYAYTVLPHRFNAAHPDASPTVYLELVDGEGEIVTDPTTLNYDSKVIRVKAIASKCDLGRGTVNQSTPLIYSYVVRTVNEDGEEIEVSFQVGNNWVDVIEKVASLFAEDTSESNYYLGTTKNSIEEYYVLKTSKYTLVLYTQGSGVCSTITLIRN